MPARALLPLLLLARASAQDGACSPLFGQPPSLCAMTLYNTTMSTVLGPRVLTMDKASDLCYLSCVACHNAQFLAWSLPQLSDPASFCGAAGGGGAASADAIIAAATDALLNSSAMHGQFFLDGPGELEENATQALAALLAGMPRRDLLLLSTDTALMADFLIEHARYALHTRAWSAAFNVSWPLFVDAVLPYAIADEKRDLWFRWRPRFARLFHEATAGAASTDDAMRALAAALPRAAALGALALTGGAGDLDVVPGQPITWHSTVSPAFISVEQVAAFGGSCTGTANVLVAAARAIGVPARLAGCGESGPGVHDDHHWVEYFSASSPGPFGDAWHTKEGTSAGNEGGPWDAPSGPMLGCLRGVTPFSAIDSMWATSWSSATYMPMLWSNDSWAARWSFVGGLDRCGAYCTAWGCGVNNSQHWTQAQCSQYAD